MSPISSPLVPWISVLLSHSDSVTVRQHLTARFVSEEGRTGAHGHAGGDALLVLDVDDLVIDDVVPALVHATAVRTRLERFRDVFDIQHVRVHNVLRPLRTAPQHLF